MINGSTYLVKAYIGEDYKKDVAGTYDITIKVTKENLEGGNLDHSAALNGRVLFYTNKPVINYTTEESNYIVVKDNGEKGYYKTPIYETKIYIPKKSLKSTPYNKGKLGTDPNVKIN